MTKINYSDREVGWLVTKDYSAGESSRRGWGQLRVHATESEASFDRPVGPTIFMDKSLTEHMIPDEHQIRWRSFDADQNVCYEGLVRFDWFFNGDEDDLMYNVDRFNMTDAGAVHVYYSVDDMITCAAKQEEHGIMIPGGPNTWTDIDGERWTEIYC
jgi:hypothetical protein